MSAQRWPTRWLMTDERMGERLWEAIARIPHGGGIVFRHYSLASDERKHLGGRVSQVAREGGLVLAVGRDVELAMTVGATLVHNPDRPSALPFSLSVHNEAEALVARESGAALAFVSPLFPTASHPGAQVLGPDRAAALAEVVGCPAVALGGMNEERFKRLAPAFHGYAGIDCWLVD